MLGNTDGVFSCAIAPLIDCSRRSRQLIAGSALSVEALTAELCRTQVPVYLTIDLDCLDPSCFPGTGTPEAGGVTFMQLLNAILTVSKTNIIGADVNELAPMLDASGVSTAMACKVLRELLLALNV